MDWERYIERDPQRMAGRPVLRGSQLPVDLVLSLLAAGWTQADILANYPWLTQEQLRAVFAFAAEAVRHQQPSALP